MFEVSGVIELQSDLVIRDDSFGAYSHLTIAGQTAPYPGITLRNYGISIRSHDILIQHIAIRPGNVVGTQGQLNNRDAIKIETPVEPTWPVQTDWRRWFGQRFNDVARRKLDQTRVLILPDGGASS